MIRYKGPFNQGDFAIDLTFVTLMKATGPDPTNYRTPSNLLERYLVSIYYCCKSLH
jgi:hypothetical protein